MTNEEILLSLTDGTAVDLAQAIVGNSPARIEVPGTSPIMIKEPPAPVNHAQISHELALAIGHRNSDVIVHHDNQVPVRVKVLTELRDDETQSRGAFHFDYRDPAVIWPIAERFDCFPYKTASGNWTTSLLAPSGATENGVDSAALAVALTVIQEQGL